MALSSGDPHSISLYNSPSRADRGGKTPDPALRGVCELLRPQHSHYWAGSIRARGPLLWLQRSRPGGEGGVIIERLVFFKKTNKLVSGFWKSVFIDLWCFVFFFFTQWNPGWSKALSQQAVHGWALVQASCRHLPGLVPPGNFFNNL